ncbi:MAG: helix-turn-helix transcriptional regulator, partial [Chloroflexi bacterium]|nr:helix-turn-helix transcriptional regulator [Chloroflexota bacterium]
EKGYQRATVKEIAARAGIAPGTIYLYFKNKRDLLLTIADHLIAQPVDQTLAQLADLDTETYIAAILQDRLQFARRNQAFLQALVTEIWTDEELRERFFTQVIGPIFATGARYLHGRVAEGELRPCRVEIVVPAVAASIAILSVLRALAPDYVLVGVSDDELMDELTRLYLYGLKSNQEEGAE